MAFYKPWHGLAPAQAMRAGRGHHRAAVRARRRTGWRRPAAPAAQGTRPPGA